MLQDIHNMTASWVFYVKISMCTDLEQCKDSLLTVNELGIVRLPVQHYLIVSGSFMYYAGNLLEQTSADVLCLQLCPINS